jgi:hypothetical protein
MDKEAGTATATSEFSSGVRALPLSSGRGPGEGEQGTRDRLDTQAFVVSPANQFPRLAFQQLDAFAQKTRANLGRRVDAFNLACLQFRQANIEVILLIA